MEENTIQIAAINKDIDFLEETEKHIVFTSLENIKEATGILKATKNRLKKIEELKEFFIKPLKIQIKKIEEMLKPGKVRLSGIETKLKNGIKDFYEKEDKKAFMETRRDSRPVPIVPRSINTEEGQLQVRTITDFEIIDFNKIPKDFLVINSPKIRLAIRAGEKISGIKTIRKKSIAIS